MAVTSRNRRKSNEREKSAQQNPCPSCAATTVPEARFCHACGAALTEPAFNPPWFSGRLVKVSGLVGALAIAVFAGAMLGGRAGTPLWSKAPAAPMFGNLPASLPDTPSLGKPIDISQMAPREAADRLFNRIMTANEQGNREEALRFVPMAVQAYNNLPSLDGDALYHLGLIHSVASDHDNLARQIAALRQGAPDHLLALSLEYGEAEQSKDSAAMTRILKAFMAAYNTEMMMDRTEYAGHRNSIERVRTAATSTGAGSPKDRPTEDPS